MEFFNCSISSDGNSVICNGTDYVKKEPPITYHDAWFWIYIAIYAILVLCAGLFSGLTLGLLSLDMTSLRVLEQAGTASQKRYARRIIPLVKRHHLLLVTLLLANAAAVEAMPLFLDRISDPVIAIAVSVTAVLFFGEVFPQALCSRYGVAIGATLAPVVYFLMGVCFVVAYPLSKLLDCMLGNEHATFFRRAELKALVDLHGPTGSPDRDELTYDEVLIIKGALELRDKTVQHAMVPLENVFMLDIDTKLNTDSINKILMAAHSRIPVYSGSRQNIAGILLVKTLVCHDPEESPTIRDLMMNRRVCRRVHIITETTPLYDLLNEFQKGKTHLSVVVKAAPPGSLETSSEVTVMKDQACCPETTEVLGIITLEDVLEELLQEEIIDETDVYVDVRNRIKVARAKACLRNMSCSTLQDFLGSNSTVDTIPHLPRRYFSIPADMAARRDMLSQDAAHTDDETTRLLHSES